MAIKELDPGESCESPHVPLRVSLTGVGVAQGVELVVMDSGQSEKVLRRISAVEGVVLPRSGRVVLGVRTVSGNPLPKGTVVGLSLRSERSDAAPWQALVALADVGALLDHRLAQLEFANGAAHLTALQGPRPRSAPARGAAKERSGPASAEETSWRNAGLYAFREALGGELPAPAPVAWGLVLDGSTSMRRLGAEGTVQQLLELVSGIMLAWIHRPAQRCAVAGVVTTEVPAAASEPSALSMHAFDRQEPSSWSSLHEAARLVLDDLSPGGLLLLVSDGVPGDVEELVTLARERADARVALVTVGTSLHGLRCEGGIDWWQEELAGSEDLVALPNVSLVALRVRSGPESTWAVDLAPPRPAELAGRLVGRAGSVP